MKSVLVIVNTSVVKDKLGRLGSNINSTPLVVVDIITIKLEHYIVQIQPTSQNTMITKSQSIKQTECFKRVKSRFMYFHCFNINRVDFVEVVNLVFSLCYSYLILHYHLTSDKPALGHILLLSLQKYSYFHDAMTISINTCSQTVLLTKCRLLKALLQLVLILRVVRVP